MRIYLRLKDYTLKHYKKSTKKYINSVLNSFSPRVFLDGSSDTIDSHDTPGANISHPLDSNNSQRPATNNPHPTPSSPGSRNGTMIRISGSDDGIPGKSRATLKNYRHCILPVLTYGAETWVTTKAILQKLIVTQRAMERRLVGVSLRDRMTNKWLRKESKVSDIVKRIANLKWQWAGHIARKSDSWCKDLLEWRPWEHKRPVGRPQMRWKDDIRKVAGQNWMLVAQDRARWRGLKEAYTKLVEEGLR
ncbi:hypothetical protein ABMA27_001230 [Loxostege sticticalis]|uniref:Endonuclease-reverse transcriptase n=1 Tax=Loxostege sticticalis TaxID=481309 RepID=A0ABR3HXR9_LOXSC